MARTSTLALVVLAAALFIGSPATDSAPPPRDFTARQVMEFDALTAVDPVATLADTGTNWIVAGTVAFDEVVTAVGDSNAIAP